MPHPLLETDTLQCAHQGRITLTSSTKGLFSINNAGVISLDDLSKASISCPNPITNGGPCSKIANIPQSVSSKMLEIDSQKIVLCENISLVTTDKGVPLKLSGEPQAKGYFEIDEGEDTANSSDTHTATLDSKASQGYEYGEEVEEKIDIAQGAYELAFGEKEEQREKIEGEDDIPDNVIRIETEDNSGEYIEIEFGKSAEEIEREIEEEDKTRQELEEFLGYPSDSIADASDSISHYQALMGNEVKTDIDNIALPRFMPRFNRPKGSKRLHKKNPPKAPEYAKNQKDVMRIVRELETAKRSKGSNKRVRLVDSKKDFRRLLYRLTRYAKKIEEKVEDIFIRKIKEQRKMIRTRYKLKDDTQIQYRSESQSGGETIEINKKDIIIHNKEQLFK